MNSIFKKNWSIIAVPMFDCSKKGVNNFNKIPGLG